MDGLLQALQAARDYYSAEAAAKRIVALGDLTPPTWARLADAYWANDQVHGGVLPTRVLQPFYRDHGRGWPPTPKPHGARLVLTCRPAAASGHADGSVVSLAVAPSRCL